MAMVLREMLIEENQLVMVNQAFSHAFRKESYANMGDVVGKKMKNTSNLGSREEISWFWQLIQQIWLFLQRYNSSVKKVLSFLGIVSPCLPKTLPFILI